MLKALLVSMVLASNAWATVNNSTPVQILDAGIRSPTLFPVGTPVYALNNALTGSASAAIDLSGTSGLWVSVTSTGAAKITVYYSNSNLSATGGSVSSFEINSNGAYPIEPKARYVSFYNSSAQPSNRASVYYYPVVASAGSATVSGTVTTNDTYVAGYLTTTAAGSAARGGSITAIALTSTVLVNITSAAGADVPCIVTIEGGAGPNAGLYWGILPSSTWLAPVTYLAVSTTPIMVTVGRGDHLQLSVTAAVVIVNVRVWYASIQ